MVLFGLRRVGYLNELAVVVCVFYHYLLKEVAYHEVLTASDHQLSLFDFHSFPDLDEGAPCLTYTDSDIFENKPSFYGIVPYHEVAAGDFPVPVELHVAPMLHLDIRKVALTYFPRLPKERAAVLIQEK